MVKNLLIHLFAVALAVLLVSCASMQPQPEPAEPAFTPQQLQMTDYDQKTDNFLVLLDASGSMGENDKGQTKFTTAEQVVSRMNQTIPGDMQLNAAVRTFGAGFSLNTTPTYGPEAYSKPDLEASLGKANYGGYTPIGLATTAGGADLASMSGDSAVILVSDGKQNVGTDAAKAAQEVKNRYGDKACFYTILVGGDPAGKELMNEIARIGQCGFATTADAVYSSEGMADFVSAVFLGQPAASSVVAAGDRDRDGVPDNLDKCPNTPKGATVNARGCWAYQGEVLFDFDKAEIKSGAYPILDEAIRVLTDNPGLNVEIQGYTDSTGAEGYNLQLSQRRAESVVDFLLSRGIDPGRLSAKGYGAASPVASNDTAEGRAKNRRVEFRAPQ